MDMPDGRRLDLATRRGVEEYVAALPRFASLNCAQLLNPKASQDAKVRAITVLCMVAYHALPSTFEGLETSGKRAVASAFRALLRGELLLRLAQLRRPALRRRGLPCQHLSDSRSLRPSLPPARSARSVRRNGTAYKAPLPFLEDRAPASLSVLPVL